MEEKVLYSFWGKVRVGKKRGKRLGYPTANIRLHKKIPEGIYVSYTKIDSKLYPSLTFIGNAKTFNERKVLVEVHILDFQQSLYGKWISIVLNKKIRDNKKFVSGKELILAMKKDEREARTYFKFFKKPT